ncbi:MAG: hypothetical protein LBR36_06025 [Bacteroidales bacterium]|nr:hypothetical protein [Bacteroidales bacterium]
MDKCMRLRLCSMKLLGEVRGYQTHKLSDSQRVVMDTINQIANCKCDTTYLQQKNKIMRLTIIHLF